MSIYGNSQISTRGAHYTRNIFQNVAVDRFVAINSAGHLPLSREAVDADCQRWDAMKDRVEYIISTVHDQLRALTYDQLDELARAPREAHGPSGNAIKSLVVDDRLTLTLVHTIRSKQRVGRGGRGYTLSVIVDGQSFVRIRSNSLPTFHTLYELDAAVLRKLLRTLHVTDLDSLVAKRRGELDASLQRMSVAQIVTA